MDIKIISSRDVGRCQRGSLLPEHYRPDGSCLCTAASVEELREMADTLEHRLADLARSVLEARRQAQALRVQLGDR